jgi:DNA-binding CsgD family transcriptional regulator
MTLPELPKQKVLSPEARIPDDSMAIVNEPSQGLQAGFAAAARGDLRGAREAIEATLDPDNAMAHEVLCGLCLALEDIHACRRHGEAAYRLYKEAGNLPRASWAAVRLAQLADFFGHDSARRGWMARAARLLAEAGPCVEQGYYELARVGCEIADVVELERRATLALEVARRFHDTDLEVRALADLGLAMVSQGRVDEGLASLDEAMAAVVAGEVRNLDIAGMSCCAMLSACDRLGDLDRAMQWNDAVKTSLRDRFGDPPPAVLQAHCRVIYGGLLGQAGQWDDAEIELRLAVDQTRCIAHRAEACARLADLRIRQGRLPDAAALLRGWEDRIQVAMTLTRLHLARDEIELAAATAAGALRQADTDLLTSGPLLALQVEIEIRRGNAVAAQEAASKLWNRAEATGLPGVVALAHLCLGRAAAASGQDPVEHLWAGLASLANQQRPQLCAELHLELATALREDTPAEAIAEGRSALAIFERLDFRPDVDRAAALLRSLGQTVRSSGGAESGLGPLSRRERDVLPLLAEGLTNAEIAKRLYITAKTAEHHVGSILSKLGLRSRAEAAAYAAGRPPVST